MFAQTRCVRSAAVSKCLTNSFPASWPWSEGTFALKPQICRHVLWKHDVWKPPSRPLVAPCLDATKLVLLRHAAWKPPSLTVVAPYLEWKPPVRSLSAPWLDWKPSIRSLDAHCLDATKSSCGRSLLGSRHFVIWLHPVRTPPSRHKEARCLDAAKIHSLVAL